MEMTPIYYLWHSPGKMNIADFSDKTLLIVDDDDPFRNCSAELWKLKALMFLPKVEEGLICQKITTRFCLVDLHLMETD